MIKKKPSKPAKYNNTKTTINGVKFDSELEAKYYLILMDQQEKGKILFFRNQPRYLLQESFKKDGKTIRKVEYVADFEVHNLDGSITVIDVKGAPPTEAFKLKAKFFNNKYPHKLLVVTYSMKWAGGWVEYDKFLKLKKEGVAFGDGKGGHCRQSKKMDDH